MIKNATEQIRIYHSSEKKLASYSIYIQNKYVKCDDYDF